VDKGLWPRVLSDLSKKADWTTIAILVLGPSYDDEKHYEKKMTCKYAAKVGNM